MVIFEKHNVFFAPINDLKELRDQVSSVLIK